MDQDLTRCASATARRVRSRFDFAIARAMAAAENESFAIGSRDCAFWIADIDVAVFGVDPAAPYRGQFGDAASRQAVLGWCGLPGAMMETAKRMGWRRIAPAAAQAGDRGLLKVGDTWMAAIFDGLFWLTRVDRGVAGFATHAAQARRCGAAIGRAWSPC